MCNNTMVCVYLGKLNKCLICLDYISWSEEVGEEHIKKCFKCGAIHEILYTALGPRIDVYDGDKLIKRVFNAGVYAITGIDMVKEVEAWYKKLEEDRVEEGMNGGGEDERSKN